MFNNLFRGLFDSELTTVISVYNFMLCFGFSLLLGLVLALAYMYRNNYTKSFVIALALIPAVVCIVIMMVNGNIGAGVAVAGAFSLVRFRSAAGTAQEICAIFLAMGTGIITGMGYLGYATIFTLVMCIVFRFYRRLDFGSRHDTSNHKIINIDIPDTMDYTGLFDNIFNTYTSSYDLTRIKCSAADSKFKLTYNIALSDVTKEKEMIDRLISLDSGLIITVSKPGAIVSAL